MPQALVVLSRRNAVRTHRQQALLQLVREAARRLEVLAVLHEASGEEDQHAAVGPETAQRLVALEEDGLRSGPRRGERGRPAGDAAADDEHVALAVDGDLPRRHRDDAGRVQRGRGAVLHRLRNRTPVLVPEVVGVGLRGQRCGHERRGTGLEHVATGEVHG